MDSVIATRQSSVLVIDPSAAILPLIQRHLDGEGVCLHLAITADNGLAMAQSLDPDLILLDLELGGNESFDLLRRLKEDEKTMSAAVIVMVTTAASGLKLRGLDAGALDYVHKPFDPAELRARVRSALKMRFLSQMLSAKSMIDTVTGLRNGVYFEQRLKQELSLAVRAGHPCSCLLLDIDGFSKINELYGHRVGDEVLKQTAAVLIGTCRGEDLLCRCGGGQFVVLAPNTPGQNLTVLAERMRHALETSKVNVRGGTIRVTASIGVAEVSKTGAEQTLNNAEAALKRAKFAGGNQVHRPEDNRSAIRAA